MEAGSSLLAQSLRERMTPVLLLLPTPGVEESCAKNNLSFRDILRPFSTVHEIDVPVRTASDQPYRLQEFRLRMFYAAEICQPTVESAEACLLKVVNSSSEEALAELPGDPQNLDVIKKMLQSESLSSWFQRYSRTFIQALAFSEHETFDHPIACMRAVSSRDDNPIHKFVELYETDSMPTLLSDGTMDPKLLKIYVLIHDYQDGPADRANEILSEMRGTFGFNDCWLLCINSGSSEPSTAGEEFWKSDTLSTTESTKDVTGSISEMKLGSLLSENDLNEITDLIAQICCKSILPYMEQKIRSLNQQVVATKKGLKNQIKNLWWRKGKDDVSDSSNNAMYTFGSIESQIRVLADYAFMLHDYELALSNYRLISSDYKTDKAWKHYAGAQEMIGLSLFLLDQSRKEAEQSMELAFSTYQKSVVSGQRYSTRCALWWAEMHKARGQYKEAASVYFRSGTEEPHLRAGIFLEQGAYCHLRTTPPMMRKYGFYLVLAGNRYNVCGQKKHALRAYMSVLTIFEGQGWNYINDHVVFHLGSLSAYLGNFSGAVQHFQKLISCSHQSPSKQAAFLKEFLQAVQNANFDSGKMLLLDLPAINKENVRVHFEDKRTYASITASMLSDDMWLPLEVGLTPVVHTATSTWMSSASSRNSLAEVIDSNESFAGETLTVDVEFINPLQVSLNLSAVSLLCRFDTEGSESKEDSEFRHEADEDRLTPSDANILRDDENQNLSAQQNLSITVAEEVFTIKSGERYKAQLKVIPHEKGLLHIMGVKWTLSGIVRGYQMFTPEEARPNSRKGKRDKPHFIPPHRRLKFFVREHMPRLEVSLHRMPEKVNSGELHRVVLELSNTSGVAIKNLKFCTSQPGILLVGEIQDLDAEFPDCLESPFVEKQKYGDKSYSGEITSASIYTFPQTVILESGSTLLWPLWLHAREAGILLLNNVLYYEASNATMGMQYRTVRMSHTLEVSPSLQVSVHISPCLRQLEQYLLRLDIANKNNTESFWLRQVSCIGSRWQMAPLLPPVAGCDASEERMSTDVSEREVAFLSASVSPSQLLPAGQTLSLFFQLLDMEKGDSTLTQPEFISNVRLGPPSSTEPLIDVTRGPVYKFHAHVKNSKEKEQSSTKHVDPLKVLDTRLDVILISEQQDEPTTEKPAALRDSQRLATQHICYCSMRQSSPLVWLMEGPTSVTHDFSRDPLCKVSFYLTLKNYSHRTASVKVSMVSADFPSETNTVLSKPAQGNQTGWYDISLETSPDSKLKEPKDSLVRKSAFEEANFPAAPFLWSSLNMFKIDRLGSQETETYPLQLSVFAPGIYDLSGYHLSWELLPEPANPEFLVMQKKVVSAATPITFSSSFVASEANQDKAGNAGSHTSNDADAISGSGSGHTFILTVEGRQECV
eukprot:c17296_g1_i1 orf=72-4250(+)